MKAHDPCKPHKILQDFIRSQGLTVDQTAEAMGIPTWKLSAILMEQKRIDAELAARLALAFGTTAEYWLQLQHEKDRCDAEEIHKKLKKKKIVKQLLAASQLPLPTAAVSNSPI